MTKQLVKVANASAEGRVLSVLEGGYKVQGGPVSALGRSVAAHVRALNAGFTQVWDTQAEREALLREVAFHAAAEAAVRAEKEREAAARAAAAGGGAEGAGALSLGLGAAAAGAAAGAAAAAAPPTGERKRRRDPVDYLALDAKLQEEKAAKAAAAAGEGGSK